MPLIKCSPNDNKCISQNIRTLRAEGYSQVQAIAIVLNIVKK